MKPKLYLHIGYPHGGETPFQTQLGENRHLLSQFGVVYPKGASKTANSNRLLSKAVLQGLGPDDLESVFQTLADQVGATGAEIAVISDATLCMLEPPQVADLAGLTAHFDVIVVAVLRRQDAALKQRYHHGIEERDGLALFVPFLQRARWDILNYARILDHWAAHFEDVRALSFDQVKGESGGVHRALVDLVSEGRLTQALPGRAERGSLPAVMTESLRRARAQGTDPDHLRQTLAAYRVVLNTGAPLAHPVFAKAYLTPALRHMILDRFEAANADLAARYFDGQAPFEGFDRATLPPLSEEAPRGANGFLGEELAAAAVEIVRLQQAYVVDREARLARGLVTPEQEL